MVEGMLASVATHRSLAARDLLRLRPLPALEFPSHPALWNICHIRVRNRSRRCAVYVPVAGERCCSQKERSTGRIKSGVRLTPLPRLPGAHSQGLIFLPAQVGTGHGTPGQLRRAFWRSSAAWFISKSRITREKIGVIRARGASRHSIPPSPESPCRTAPASCSDTSISCA